MEEALKKAGLSESEPAAPAEPTGPASPENSEATAAPAVDAKPDTKPPETKPEAKKDHQCSKCGAVFLPKHPKHRLCPKCADEHFTARPPRRAERPERPERPAGTVGTAAAAEKPAREAKTYAAEPPPSATEKPAPAARPAPRRPAERDRPQRPLPQSLPQDYLASGYFGSGGRVRDEVYTAWALRVADVLVERRLKSRQLRAFYNHVKRAEIGLNAGRDIHLVRADILKIKPFAAERQGRGFIPAEFREFLDRNVDQVKDEKTLRAFAEHFQAVVGYATGRLKN